MRDFVAGNVGKPEESSNQRHVHYFLGCHLFGSLGSESGAVVRRQAQTLFHGRVVLAGVASANVRGVLLDQVLDV